MLPKDKPNVDYKDVTTQIYMSNALVKIGS
jgi:hypothetical protein